jgi:hypothetical protein
LRCVECICSRGVISGESSGVGHRGDEHAELKLAVDSQERRGMEVKATVGHSWSQPDPRAALYFGITLEDNDDG